MYQHKMQHCYSKVYHQQHSAAEYTSHDFRGGNKLVSGHEVADRNFLLEDIESAEFSLLSVVGSIGLTKAVRVGKWRESVLSQLTCTAINGRHALYNLIRSIRGHRFLMLRPRLRGPTCGLTFVEQGADAAADERAPLPSSLQSPLQSFPTRSVWDAGYAAAAGAVGPEKIQRGPQAAPDAGRAEQAPGARQLRGVGKSRTEGGARTQGGGPRLRGALRQRDLLSLALPTARLSNFQTGSNKPSLISLTPNWNTVRKTRLEMEVVYHKEFTKQKRRASFSTSQRLSTEIKTGVRSISLEEVAVSLSGHVGKAPRAQGDRGHLCSRIIVQISLCLNMPSFNFYKWGKKKKKKK